jgi:xanthine/CO dehydrogenase XdhC/CoxF family maturation factor
MSLIHRLAELRESEERGILFTAVEGEVAGTKVLVLESGERVGDGLDDAVAQFDELIRRGRNKLLELDDGSKVFAEWYGPPPRLFVYGAVDTAEALCRAASLLGWHTIVADARGKFSRPRSASRRQTSSSSSGRRRRLRRSPPTTRRRSSCSLMTTSSTSQR